VPNAQNDRLKSTTEDDDFDYDQGYLSVDGLTDGRIQINEPTVNATEATRQARLDIVSAVMGSGDRAADRAEPIIPIKSLRGLKAEENTELEIKPSVVDDNKQAESISLDTKENAREPFFKDYRIVGQVFNTYWIVECNGSVYMIDQHAAHERILYEELRAKLKAEANIGQLLLEPDVVNVTEVEKQIIEDNRELLESFGFEFELFGENCYAVRSVPYIFTKYDYTASFTEIIDSLADKSLTTLYDTKLDAVATMSCKAAVKAHDRLSEQEARTLVERLLGLENPFNCPHGRPTIIEMTRYELEKKFKRIQG
jgi:DNA mismatch repair protein MutL